MHHIMSRPKGQRRCAESCWSTFSGTTLCPVWARRHRVVVVCVWGVCVCGGGANMHHAHSRTYAHDARTRLKSSRQYTSPCTLCTDRYTCLTHVRTPVYIHVHRLEDVAKPVARKLGARGTEWGERKAHRAAVTRRSPCPAPINPSLSSTALSSNAAGVELPGWLSRRIPSALAPLYCSALGSAI